MSERAELNFPPKLYQIFNDLQSKLTPDEQALVMDQMADILAHLVDSADKFNCSVSEFYGEITAHYESIGSMAEQGHALLEISIVDGVATRIGGSFIPPMLYSTMLAAQKRNALKLVTANKPAETTAPVA